MYVFALYPAWWFDRLLSSRRYSADLPQGGLEVPCTLTFVVSVKDVRKGERLVRSALTPANPERAKCSTNQEEEAQRH